MSDRNLLKLVARDAQDLAVVAAVAQDALVPLSEMTFLPSEQRFVMVLNRFCWDRVKEDIDIGPAGPAESRRKARGRDVPFWDASDRGAPYERIRAGLRFDKVTAVRTRGIDLRNRDRILELLTIRYEPQSVLLVFAGDLAIRLDVEELQCFIEDFGEGWTTRYRPHHPEGGGNRASG